MQLLAESQFRIDEIPALRQSIPEMENCGGGEYIPFN
ncbi:MAG: hypothetical protein JWN69_2076 [Alphaproteobacteria bacterium]|nr:hypothetical protein [Alphaproteobacteria bacterium]